MRLQAVNLCVKLSFSDVLSVQVVVVAAVILLVFSMGLPAFLIHKTRRCTRRSTFRSERCTPIDMFASTFFLILIVDHAGSLSPHLLVAPSSHFTSKSKYASTQYMQTYMHVRMFVEFMTMSVVRLNNSRSGYSNDCKVSPILSTLTLISLWYRHSLWGKHLIFDRFSFLKDLTKTTFSADFRTIISRGLWSSWYTQGAWQNMCQNIYC